MKCSICKKEATSWFQTTPYCNKHFLIKDDPKIKKKVEYKRKSVASKLYSLLKEKLNIGSKDV